MQIDLAETIEFSRVIERFNEHSDRLQVKYEQLMTETKILREQLREKEEQIRQSAQLATLGQMAAGLAHEVRNPLGAKKLLLSLLKDDLKDKAGLLEIVLQLDQSLDSLNQVVSNMLLFAKSEKAIKGLLNLSNLVEQVVAEFKTQLKPQIYLDSELTRNLYLIGNEVGLRQLLHNLLLNAVQAIGEVGIIFVKLSGQTGSSVYLSIQDTGPGISDEIKEKLFTPFVTTKSAGTGLGLAIVKKIIDEHGAVISVENNPGACFMIEFKPEIKPIGSAV